MKIGILSQWYDPEPGPASLPGVYAREFVARGHDVSVLTGFPNYPDGKLYDGYRIRRRTRERIDDAEVTRVAVYPNHSSSAIGRIANYASFALSASASGRSALRDVDAVWVYNSPVTVSLPLLRHTRGGRTPFFLHVQDLWPDSLLDSGMIPPGVVRRLTAKIVDSVVRFTERRAAVVGVCSQSVRGIILERHPDIDPERIVYAPNPTNEALFRPVAETRGRLDICPVPEGPVEVLYAGAIGEVQGLDTLLDAAKLLRAEDVRISLAGDGISRKRLEQRVEDEGLDNVRFLGRVPQSDVPELIARAHIHLVSLADAPFLAHTTPSKIATLLASAVPIVGHLAGDGARLVRDSGAGVTVAPGDAPALATAIAAMVASGPESWRVSGDRGRRYYDQNLSAAATSDSILQALAAAVRSNNEGSQQ